MVLKRMEPLGDPQRRKIDDSLPLSQRYSLRLN